MTDLIPPGSTRRPYPVRARLLTVAHIEELSSDMRRMVLTGEDLESTLSLVPLATADHVKVVIPDESTGNVALPLVGRHGLTLSDGTAPVIRTYTIRAVDPDQRHLTIDFVLHDHGPAGRWASKARCGARIGVMGPRGSTIYPSRYSRYVIAADETGLPAAERWIEEAPAGTEVDVFALIADASRQRVLPLRPGLSLHWLHRQKGDDLTVAVREAVPVDDGATFVWAAAEAASMGTLASHLRDTAGFHPRSIDVHGYWKRGEADHQGSRDRNRPPAT